MLQVFYAANSAPFLKNKKERKKELSHQEKEVFFVDENTSGRGGGL